MKLLKLALPVLLLSCTTQAGVIALAPHIVENIYELGAGDQILATTEHSDYPAQAKAIPRVGNYISLQIEKILALKPDYVVAWRNGNPPADLERLEKLGLRLVDSTPKKLSDVAIELRTLGKLLGKTEVGEQKAQSFEQRLADLKERYQNRAKLKVFYELWPEPLTTVAQGSWPQQILELCGAENVFSRLKGEYPMISYEAVLIAKPDVIIQPHDSARQLPATDWSKWQSIPAVANDSYVNPNADLLHRMTTRMLDEAELLCQQLDLLRLQQ